MKYEGQICRAPMERASFMLPVAVGCSYNRCRFCTLFKHLQYRELPMEQIEAELTRVKEAGGKLKTVFLGDGNAFGLGTDKLLAIIELVRNYFPECSTFNMDATVINIQNKSDHELKQLKAAGITHLYLGIESGLEDVLAFMEKDHNLSEAYEAIGRLHEQGFLYDAHIMTGVAGKGRGLENAQATADFFNRTKPKRIINFSMFLHREAPLYKSITAGEFVPADELENLIEEKKLLELLDVDDLEYDGFHDFIEFRVRGKLPQDKEKMLDKIENEIRKRQAFASVFAVI